LCLCDTAFELYINLKNQSSLFDASAVKKLRDDIQLTNRGFYIYFYMSNGYNEDSLQSKLVQGSNYDRLSMIKLPYEYECFKLLHALKRSGAILRLEFVNSQGVSLNCDDFIGYNLPSKVGGGPTVAVSNSSFFFLKKSGIKVKEIGGVNIFFRNEVSQKLDQPAQTVFKSFFVFGSFEKPFFATKQLLNEIVSSFSFRKQRKLILVKAPNGDILTHEEAISSGVGGVILCSFLLGDKGEGSGP